MPHTGPRPDQLAHGVDDVAQRRRVARAVGQEDRVGSLAGQLGAVAVHGCSSTRAPARDEVAHDRALDPGVDDRDPRPVAVAVLAHGRRGHLAREVQAGHRRLGRDPLARLGLAHRRREDPAAHGARGADVAHQRARVDAGDGRHAAVGQPVQPAALGPGASSRLTAARMIAARAHGRSDSIASCETP
jgi:hypothetical protein